MPKHKLIIGLTGGIGSGKTAASDYFQKIGINIIDADIVARAVVQPETAAWHQIKDYFGTEVLEANGQLNRAWLRKQIFANPEQRRWLESITHPAIRTEIIDQLGKVQSDYGILVSPLLLESGQNELVDRVLLIDVPTTLQRQRTQIRDNNSAAQVDAIIAAQMPRQARISRADDIIINDQSLEHLQQACQALHQQYLQLSQLK
ncbi:dephospho-CoA kinase [Oceanospirillum multiglobuliferum]|uniref:Dephospho-CoA kinase n=1 Tax=Oceanospirillum multiglobuliferum TaxID=64969 RepID=A0A1T4KQ61_9GAMM|nr:dephospho-CoA kinase [Oceanospirillum multiglobuliferum]OPX56103.1 dephospho-CoA kinase [Oceanospirillum multiglobuliferum]SJZ44541.1 dephospho-CoA kinase [Oceanospirillum multiglobuliferum]